MRLETHMQSSGQPQALRMVTAPAISSNHLVTAVCLLGRRRNWLGAGGALDCDPLPLPSRDIFCSVLLAEALLKSGGRQDLGRRCPMPSGRMHLRHSGQFCWLVTCKSVFGQCRQRSPKQPLLVGPALGWHYPLPHMPAYPGPCRLRDPPAVSCFAKHSGCWVPI